MNAKEFALNAIKPYYKDPSICGFEGVNCVYLTEDGRKCVLGQYLLNPEKHAKSGSVASYILDGWRQADILKPEAVDMLTPQQWDHLQQIHDRIAKSFTRDKLEDVVDRSGLFTMEELES